MLRSSGANFRGSALPAPHAHLAKVRRPSASKSDRSGTGAATTSSSGSKPEDRITPQPLMLPRESCLKRVGIRGYDEPVILGL